MTTVFKGRNHPIRHLLRWNNTSFTLAEMEAITKAEVGINGVYVDSDSYPDSFDWVTHKSTSEIVFDIGPLEALEASRDKKVELIIYDPDHPQGRVISQIDIAIASDAEESGTLAGSL